MQAQAPKLITPRISIKRIKKSIAVAAQIDMTTQHYFRASFQVVHAC